MGYSCRDEESCGCSNSVPVAPPSEIEMLEKKIVGVYVLAKNLKDTIAQKNNQYFGLETSEEKEIEVNNVFCNMSVMLDYLEESVKNAVEYIKRV